MKMNIITAALFTIPLFGIISNTKAQTQINDIEFRGFHITEHEVNTYYRMHNVLRGKKTFWKFVFQFKLVEGSPTKTMDLICYAVNRPKQVIDGSRRVNITNTVPIVVDATIPIVKALSPVILGNLELTRKQLDTLIGKRRNPLKFNFLYIIPIKNTAGNQILYEVKTDRPHVEGDKSPLPLQLNPCPPGQPY